MIYTQSQTPAETVLVAQVAVWQELLDTRPIKRDRSVVSYQLKPGETITDANWLRLVSLIEAAIVGKADDAVARVRVPADLAGPVLELAQR